MSRRGHVRLAPLVLVVLLSLSACGDTGNATDESSPSESSPSEPSPSESSPSEPSPSETPEDQGLVVDLTRKGDEFTPNGARVDAVIGEPVILSITSDEAGELHVHSVPEQEIAYDAGTSEHEITIDRPGVVEVESHDPDVIVVQLEVR